MGASMRSASGSGNVVFSSEYPRKPLHVVEVAWFASGRRYTCEHDLAFLRRHHGFGATFGMYPLT